MTSAVPVSCLTIKNKSRSLESTLQVLLTSLTAFIFTGVFANWLVQRWQHRNWLNQQRFLGAEKRFEALRSHADDFARVASVRLSAMYRLLLAINMNSEILEDRVKIYSNTITEWNINISTVYSRTTMYIGWYLTKQIEDEIHYPFVNVGAKIEGLVRNKRNHPEQRIGVASILSELDSLQGRLTIINRDMLRHVLNQQAATYQGVEVGYKNLQ